MRFITIIDLLITVYVAVVAPCGGRRPATQLEPVER